MMTWLFVIALSALAGCASTIMRQQEPVGNPEVRAQPLEAQPPDRPRSHNTPVDARAGLDNLTAKIDRAREILDHGDSLTESKR